MPDKPQCQLSRRTFLAASAAAAGAAATIARGAPADAPLPVAPAVEKPAEKTESSRGARMKIAEALPASPGALWRLVKQCGVDYSVGVSGGRIRLGDDAGPGEPAWSRRALEHVKKLYEEGGFKLAVLEWRPPLAKAKLGLPGRDEEIETVCELVRNMGAVGIPVWCYEWMVLGVLRTSSTLPGRGGALVTGYDYAQMKDLSPSKYGEVKDEQLWANLEYFLKRVLPVAEKAGVKLAMHPDDPPLSPIRGVARIMRSVENFQRLVDLVPSDSNGITLCQGNFTLMTDDLPGVIRQFGKQKKIFFVHFRDVRGTPEKYVETFHDEGKTDMAACLRAYREVGFDGVCRPDHVPTMEGDNNDKPSYSTIGRLFAIGYIKGLEDAVYGK
ncbi:MAG: mannonate dehydratase [Pirellulales bacterium]